MTVRVLQVCPFGIPSEPASGGQIRISAIARAYEAAGCTVDRCCVVTRKRDTYNPLDVVMPWLDRIRRYHLGKPGNLGQIRQHWAAIKGQGLQHQLRAKLDRRYDLVHVEHPWGMALVNQLRDHASLREARLVCSTHNVEQELFESTVRERQEWTPAAKRLADEIGRIEREAVKVADLVWTVSQHDADVLSKFGSSCVVAPNGCRALPDQADDPAFSSLNEPYALFVGANYGPNIHGFLGMLGDDLDFLPNGSSVHTVGTCGQHLQGHEPHQHAQQAGRLVHHGRVSQSTLDAALRHACVMILPISSGGGTNLKTAEALATGHAVLGTPQAFRGFEDWMQAANVHVAGDPTTFRKKLAELLTTPANTAVRTKTERAALTWPEVLQPAVTQTLGLLRSSQS